MCVTALFTISPNWKKQRSFSIDEWINKPCYMYKMEYYLPIKVNELSSNEHNIDDP